MKNIIQFNTNSYCCESGFFTKTPNGGDYTTCPLCENGDWESTISNTYMNTLQSHYKSFMNEDGSLGSENYSFCNECKILFNIGCVHSMNGCTSNIYNAHLIGKWRHQGNTYTGMPRFDTLIEYITTIKDIEILGEICPNNVLKCTSEGTAYPNDKFPQYYKPCQLSL